MFQSDDFLIYFYLNAHYKTSLQNLGNILPVTETFSQKTDHIFEDIVHLG